jgi:NAD(P)-dependent dehydrogenase (short-subunit alcohol dehydrogenase family)
MNQDAARMAVMEKHLRLGRIATLADHASLFVLLASKTQSAYITGAMLQSDGG